MRANFVDNYLQGMRDRSVQSATDLAREIKLTDWSMVGNLSNRSSGVQIPQHAGENCFITLHQVQT